MNFYKILVPIILGFSVAIGYAQPCKPACHMVGDVVGDNKIVGVQTIHSNQTDVFLMPATTTSAKAAPTNLLSTAQALSALINSRSNTTGNNTVNCALLNKSTGEIGCKVIYITQ